MKRLTFNPQHTQVENSPLIPDHNQWLVHRERVIGFVEASTHRHSNIKHLQYVVSELHNSLSNVLCVLSSTSSLHKKIKALTVQAALAILKMLAKTNNNLFKNLFFHLQIDEKGHGGLVLLNISRIKHERTRIYQCIFIYERIEMALKAVKIH